MSADQTQCGSSDFCLGNGSCDCDIPGNHYREPAVTDAASHDSEESAFLCASGNERCPTPEACAADPDNCTADISHLPMAW